MLTHRLLVEDEDILPFFDEAELAQFPVIPPPAQEPTLFPQLTIMEFQKLPKLLHALDARLRALTDTWTDGMQVGNLAALRQCMNAILLLRAEVREYRSPGLRAFIERLVLVQPGWLLLRPWQQAYLGTLLGPYLDTAGVQELAQLLWTPRSYSELPDEDWDVILRILDALLTQRATKGRFGRDLAPAIQILVECLTMTRFAAHHVHAVLDVVSVSPPQSWRDDLFTLARTVGGAATALPDTHRQHLEDE